MLNQLTLDRGPKTRIPDGCTYTDDNCWAAGNAGEMDFLEPGMSKGQATDEAVTSEYRASWSTLNNRMCARLSSLTPSPLLLLTRPLGAQGSHVPGRRQHGRLVLQ